MTDFSETEWLADYLLSVLRSPTWAAPIATFLDERCGAFEACEENRLEYTQCHSDFKQLIDSLLAAHLLEVDIPPEHFDTLCLNGLLRNNHDLHRVLVQQLLSIDDFMTFKTMMVRRNQSLNRTAALLCHSEAADASFVADESDEDMLECMNINDLVSQELDQILVGSVNPSSVAAQSLPEEPLPSELHVEAEASVDSDLPPPPPPPPPPAEDQAVHAEAEPSCPAAAAAVTAEPTVPVQPSLHRRVMLEPLPSRVHALPSINFISPPSLPQAAATIIESEAKGVSEVPTNHGLSVPAPPQIPVAMPTQAEREARAAHLQKQRERLLEKRQMDREKKVAAHAAAGSSQANGSLNKRVAAPTRGTDRAWAEAKCGSVATMLRQAITSDLRHSLATSGATQLPAKGGAKDHENALLRQRCGGS